MASRVTYVSYCESYKPSLPSYIVELIQQKNIILRLARKTKHPFFITQLRFYSKAIRREVFAHKRSSWQKYCNTLNTVNVNQFWKKVRKIFSTINPPINGLILTNGTVVSSANEMCDLAKSFYEDQFSEHIDTSTQIEIEAQQIVKRLKSELANSKPSPPIIKTKDIYKTILSLKNKSSSGIDGVSNKIIKLLPLSHHLFICLSFNYFLSELCVPAHWKTAKMILLSKTKSNLVKINDTRPISLLPSFSKAFEKCFLSYFN